MTPILYAFQGGSPASSWTPLEVAAGIALAILISISGWIGYTLWGMTKDMSAIKQLLLGFDGKGENGSLLGQIKTLRSEMKAVNVRHKEEDVLRTRGVVVTPGYVGPDRREIARREDDPPPPGAAT